MHSDSSKDLPHKVIILAFAVDKRENCINSLLGSFFYHLKPILSGEPPEGPCSKLENRLNKLNRDMIYGKA